MSSHSLSRFQDPAIRRHVFDGLVRDNQDWIYRYCVNRLGELSGEEVAQEVFLAAWEGLAEFREEAKLETWLYGIAQNKCRQVLRNIRRREELAREFDQEIRINVHAALPDPRCTEPDPQAQQQQLEHGMRALQSEERLVLNLRYTKGLGVAEIAELMGKSEAAVRKQLLRSLQQLRKVVNHGST